jgi:hypothetical protein
MRELASKMLALPGLGPILAYVHPLPVFQFCFYGILGRIAYRSGELIAISNQMIVILALPEWPAAFEDFVRRER